MDTEHEQLSTFTQLQFKSAGSNGATKFRGRLIRAGEIRNVLDQPAGTIIPPETLQTAVNKNQFNNLACFIDHAGGGFFFKDSPSLKNLFGVWSDIAWNEETQGVDGTLTVYPSDQNEAIAQLFKSATAEEGPAPDVGVSIVFYAEWQKPDPGASHAKRKLASFRKIESADLVFMPAADGRILEALSALNQRMEVKNMPEKIKTAEPNEELAVDEVVTPDFVEAQEQLGEEWLQTIREQGLMTIWNNSTLPEVVKKRLMRKRYTTPEQVHAAIQEAHEELQALDKEETVELGQRPYLYVKDPRDEIQSHVEWFFGVEGAPLPPSNYRKLDQLYVAMTGDSEFHGVYYPEKVVLAAASTGTLAGMAVDAMNKVIMTQMSRLQFWRWYEKIAYPIPNDGSVHSMKLISFGGIGDLPTVAEGAAYTEATVDDVKETATFYKKGAYVGITLEMIRNSSIVEIQAVPKALAIAAVRTRSAAVSALFTSNSGVGPTLAQDSTALFHANHSNVQTTALGTDATAWRAARVECFNHTEVNSGKKLAVFPKFLLVPDDLYDVALTITGYGEGMPTTYMPEAQARSAEDPRPVVVVVPDWTDATDWAYLVDPQIYPVIQMSYAQAPGGGSHPAPELYSVVNENQGLLFTNDVMPIKVRDWFAVNVNGPRGIGKRNVA